MLQILKYIISDSHSYKACHAPKDKPLCCSAMAGKHRLTVPRHAFRLLWRLQRSFGLKCMADCHCLPFRIRCALNKLSPGALATETCLPESIFVSPEGDFRQPLTQKHSAGRLLVIACKRDTQNHLGTRLLGISGFLGCCNLFAASLLLGLLSPAVSKLGAWAWGPPAVSKLGFQTQGCLAWLGASGGGLGLGGPPAVSKLGLGAWAGLRV